MNLQSWNGLVIALCDETFVARFLDLKHPMADTQLIEIDVAKLPTEELQYLSVGATVVWTIDSTSEETLERIWIIHDLT